MALLIAGSAEAGRLVLAEEGVAKAFILAPASPSMMEKYAAEHMARRLARITGGTF